MFLQKYAASLNFSILESSLILTSKLMSAICSLSKTLYGWDFVVYSLTITEVVIYFSSDNNGHICIIRYVVIYCYFYSYLLVR